MRAHGGLFDDLVKRLRYGLRHQKHALSAAERAVVHALVHALTMVAQLVTAHLQIPACARTADDAFTQNALTHLGKQRGDINPHRHFPHRL